MVCAGADAPTLASARVARDSVNEVSVFHSPQAGHWPDQRGASAPQAEQTKTVRGLAMVVRNAGAAMLACVRPHATPRPDCGPGRALTHNTLKFRPLAVSAGRMHVYDSWIRVVTDRRRMPDESSRGGWLRNLSSSAGKKAGDPSRKIGKPLEFAVKEKPAPFADLSPVQSGRARALRTGQLFHHFRLQQQLGRGATATVFKAVDERNGNVVALKTLTLTDDWPEDLLDEARLRLLREADAAGSLAHPDIVEIRESGEHEGLVYLAMEYVEGVNLGTHATEGRMLPPRLVCEMCARVADALYFAHQRGVIHRDIKPANVVFDQRNRRVRVMDFGVARLENSRATRTGVILGSPSYMAPEQLDARPVTAQSDLFSLGVTLFQLLTGMLPFRSDSIPGLMQKISAEPHPPLKVVRPDLPAALSAVIDRALEKDPEMRYRSGAEMAQALRDCARDVDPALR
jgi:serine/threonine-protein kinase